MNFLKNNKAFTIIELVVVIAIIGILASIVIVNVTGYMEKAKIARVNTEVQNISKALEMFYATYGNYPYSQADWGCSNNNWCYTQFYSSAQGGEGEPYLTVDGTNHYFSEFYKSDWTGYNANYFVNNGFYLVALMDYDNDGKIGCGYTELMDANWRTYGIKAFLCQDCNYCDWLNYPFQSTPYW